MEMTEIRMDKRDLDDPVMVHDGMRLSFSTKGELCFPMVCCDCGLTHIIKFELKGDQVILRLWRVDEATNAIREKAKKAVGSPAFIRACEKFAFGEILMDGEKI